VNALERLTEADAVKRLAERDTSLFSDDIDVRIAIGQRLGWTDLAAKAPERFTLLGNLALAIAGEGATDVLLLGMGGSSLAPLVFSRMLGPVAGAPTLHVLDTTSPRQIRATLDALDPAKTFVIVASKSGGTIEPLSLYAIARRWLEGSMSRPEAGRRCIVITDPGSSLEKLRQRDLMRVALTAPASVGGRYSALTVFGLAPAALAGIELAPIIERARRMEEACALLAPASPAALLAAWIVDAHAAGRDKLTLVTSASFAPFGLWVEQLVAESLGKHGIGVVPVIEYEPTLPSGYSGDRAVVVIREASDAALAEWAAAVAAEHPVLELTVDGALDVAAEFVRWEWATALAGFLLGVNPFDEPNVTQAKQATSDILSGRTEVPHAAADLEGSWMTFAGSLAAPEPLPSSRPGVLGALTRSLAPGDYLAILAYLPEDERLLGPLRHAATAVSRATGRAVMLELGPRYLHSTGQLHKGGTPNGAFLLITARDRDDFEVPGKPYRLAALHRAQAEGDLVTLAAAGGRALRVDLPSSDLEVVDALAQDLIASTRA
jgi:glucose-6-phosphate isomerase